jgi:hypothetical protein
MIYLNVTNRVQLFFFTYQLTISFSFSFEASRKLTCFHWSGFEPTTYCSTTAFTFLSDHEVKQDLEEDGEYDGGKHGGDEHLLGRDDLHVDHLDEGEADGTSEAAVSHDELFLKVDSFDTTPVGEPRQAVDAFSTITIKIQIIFLIKLKLIFILIFYN